MKNTMSNPPRIEILLEEESAQMVLSRLATKILEKVDVELELIHLRGIKSSRATIHKKLENRLRAYRGMIRNGDNVGVMILIDKDHHDCKKLKQDLETVVQRVGLHTKTSPHGDRFRVVNRIVIEELEAWYFGDPAAIKAAYPKINDSVLQERSRNPDAIKGGTKEKFYQLLKKSGYYRGCSMQMDIADNISPHMQPDRNTSPSFKHFANGMKALSHQLLSP